METRVEGATKMEWSSWLDLRLRLLWMKHDLPMVDLCERLGKLEEAAVCGRAQALGLGERPEIHLFETTKRDARRTNVYGDDTDKATLYALNKIKKAAAEGPEEQREPRVTAEKWREATAEDLEIEQDRRCTLLELGTGRCRWPVGNPGEAGFFFCNAEALPLKPYCGPHCQRAYRKPWDREDYIP